MIILLLHMFTTQSASTSLFTFGKQGNTDDWFIINDGVMGGLSAGTVTDTEQTTIFEGTVSLDNNGGFTAYRSPYGTFDFSAYETVTIRARGGGQVIGFSLQMARAYYEPYYRVTFEPTNEWQEYTFSLRDMPAMRLGRSLGWSMTTAELAKVIRLGFITTAKKAGAFEVEIDYIKFQ